MGMMTEEEFAKRELIKRITLTNGTIDLRMPLMKDVFVELVSGDKNALILKMVCTSTNMSYDDYLNLPYADGIRLIEPLNNFLEAIKAYENGPDKKVKKQ
jgi:hypothetical protein